MKFGIGQTGELIADPGAVFNGDVQIGSGGTLQTSGTFTASDTVSFSGYGTGTLILDDPADFHGAITDIQPGDTIDLAKVTPASAALALSVSGATLNVYFPIHRRNEYDRNEFCRSFGLS